MNYLELTPEPADAEVCNRNKIHVSVVSLSIGELIDPRSRSTLFIELPCQRRGDGRYLSTNLLPATFFVGGAATKSIVSSVGSRRKPPETGQRLQ